MLALTYCFSLLGEAPESQDPGNSRTCWDHVGTFFALGRLFFGLGRFLSDSCTFFPHVGHFFRVLGRSGLDFEGSGAGFGTFKTTFVVDFWC